MPVLPTREECIEQSNKAYLLAESYWSGSLGGRPNHHMARQQCAKALELNKENVDANSLMGRLCVCSKQLEKATHYFSQAYQYSRSLAERESNAKEILRIEYKNRSKGISWGNLGFEYFTKGKYLEARICFVTALYNKEKITARGYSLDRLLELSNVYERNPEPTALDWNTHALIYISKGDLTTAKICFAEGLKINPRDYELNLNLGHLNFYFRYGQRNFKTAKQHYDIAFDVATNPEQKRVPSNMIEILIGLQDKPSKCSQDFLDLVSIFKAQDGYDPEIELICLSESSDINTEGHGVAKYQLGQYFLKLNALDKAKQFFEDALSSAVREALRGARKGGLLSAKTAQRGGAFGANCMWALQEIEAIKHPTPPLVHPIKRRVTISDCPSTIFGESPKTHSIPDAIGERDCLIRNPMLPPASW